MSTLWKDNWDETKRHFLDWWDHHGVVYSVGGEVEKRLVPREDIQVPLVDSATLWTTPKLLALYRHEQMVRRNFVADNLPISGGSVFDRQYLALILGAKPVFNADTSWYYPAVDELSQLPQLAFKEDHPWWRNIEETISEELHLADGHYFSSSPSLTENLDILDTLCGTDKIMMAMLERPDWVKEKIAEINRAFFAAHDRIYDLIKLPDGSSFQAVLQLWAPGKVAYLQCDESAMISPAMFDEFVMPALIEQCDYLDHSVYHLDGDNALKHLDSLLSIKNLDAIQWVPGAGKPDGGSREWYELYNKILDAGKSLQVTGARKNEVGALLDAVGGRGVYFMWGLGDIHTCQDLEELERIVAPFRRRNHCE